MRFVETPIFTDRIVEILTDEEYRQLQIALALRPDRGALIRGSGGLRKMRWGAQGRGKRGGVRIIYYWHGADEVVFLVFVYDKRTMNNPVPKQLRALRQTIEEFP